MIILDQNNKQIDTTKIEVVEQVLVEHFIKPNDSVLELGARYGSVSCTINKILSDKSKQVSVEPDERVWDALELNKLNNDCHFEIVKGFMSNKKMSLKNLNVYKGGYGSKSYEDSNSTIKSYTLENYDSQYNFNVLVADCEGFLEQFINENKDFIKKLRLIIFEADYPKECNYKYIRQFLKHNNFKEIIKGQQNIFIKQYYNYKP